MVLVWATGRDGRGDIYRQVVAVNPVTGLDGWKMEDRIEWGVSIGVESRSIRVGENPFLCR